MVIRVACPCGKNLAVRNDMRGKHIQCPTCFSLVEIPSRWWWKRNPPATADKQPARRRTAPAPRPHSRGAPPEEQPPGTQSASTVDRARPAGRREVPVIRLRHPPRWTRLLAKRVESRWYHSLAYPLAVVPIFCWLGVVLSLLTAAALFFWVSIDRGLPQPLPRQAFAGTLVLMFYVLGCACSYLNSVLSLAARGLTKREPGFDAAPLRALHSFGLWLASMLAGPGLVFGAAYGYWIHCGDPTFVDGMILAELCLAGVGWWLFSMLLINVAETTRVPLPGRVLRTAMRLRGKSIELI